jgi:hypothetical protein
MSGITMNHLFLSPPPHTRTLMVCAALLLFITACTERQTEPPPVVSTPSAPTVFAVDQWLGKWIGPEGTFLQLTGGQGTYTVTIQNLDGPRTFQGKAVGNQIEFERHGVQESVHASNGAQTGMKWLSEKTNCLTVRLGEGYCRD